MRHKISLLLAILSLNIGVEIASSATDITETQGLQVISSFGGYLSYNISVSSGYLCSIEGTTLDIFRINAPDDLELISRTYCGGSCGDIASSENLVAIAKGEHGLRILDIANTSEPTLIADLPLESTYVEVCNNHVYSAAEEVFSVLDVSDPNAPRLTTQLVFEDSIEAISVDGDMAIVSAGNRLEVFSITDPSCPKLISVLETNGVYTDLSMDDGRVVGHFLSTGTTSSDSVHFLSLISQHDPELIFEFPVSKYVDSTVSGDWVYVRAWNDRVTAFDFSNPKYGAIIVPYLRNWKCLEGENGYVFSVDSLQNRLDSLIVSRSSPSYSLNHLYVAEEHFNGMLVDGSDAVLLGRNLILLDLSTPKSPLAVKTEFDLPSEEPLNSTLCYPYLYQSLNRTGIHVIRLVENGHHQLVSTFPMEDDHRLVSDDGILIGTAFMSTVVFSTDDPLVLQVLSTQPVTSSLPAILDGTRMCVINGFSIRIFDISEQTDPIQILRYEASHNPLDVQTVRDYMYVATFDSGVEIIDISVPSNPLLVGRVSDGKRIPRLVRAGELLAMNWYDETASGFDLLDLSDPINPVSIAGMHSSIYKDVFVGPLPNGVVAVQEKSSRGPLFQVVARQIETRAERIMALAVNDLVGEATIADNTITYIQGETVIEGTFTTTFTDIGPVEVCDSPTFENGTSGEAGWRAGTCLFTAITRDPADVSVANSLADAVYNVAVQDGLIPACDDAIPTFTPSPTPSPTPETTPTPTYVPTCVPTPTPDVDVNGDGTVNYLDLFLFQDYWQSMNETPFEQIISR